MLHAVTFRSLAVTACGWLIACNAMGAEAAPDPRPAAAATPPQTVPQPEFPQGDAIAAQKRKEATRPRQRQKLEPAGADPVLRLQLAERELQALREEMRQNTVSLAALRAEVEQARGSREAARALVTTLSVFLAALLAWLAWRWRGEERIARVGRWFAARSELAEPPLPIVDAGAPRHWTPAPPAPVPSQRASTSPAPSASLPLVATRAGKPPEPVARPGRNGDARPPGVEEVLDVHDKAGFFLSIGEHEQAIAVLEAHVRDDEATSPLVWMALLELYHRFGRRGEFEVLRGEFQQCFGAQLPEFTQFGEPGRGLEEHASVMDDIVALWPSRGVLEAIGKTIFRRTGPSGAEAFHLDAYRELALLYHIARDMLPPEEAVARSSVQPVSSRSSSEHAIDTRPASAPAPAATGLDPLLIPHASPRLGVDIDLGDAAPVAESMTTLDFDISGFEPTVAPRKRP